MNKQLTGLATEALLTQLEFENLSTNNVPLSVLKRMLRILNMCPKTVVLAKIGLEAMDISASSNSTGAMAVLSAALIDLKRHEEQIQDCIAKLNRFAEWLSTDVGGDLFRQAAGVADRTVDFAKVSRAGRLLLNGSISSGNSSDSQLLLQQVSEFLRIAEILTDTDVLVLKAIYIQQKPLVGRYRELTKDISSERELQDGWTQMVFEAWKQTRFVGPDDRPIGFLQAMSALQRLQAQGLIGRATSQIVTADIASTPYGLLDLGALFIEQAVAHNGQIDDKAGIS